MMDMENLGTEVSAKIRSAIKAKLVELNAYVDDELPDYIMVMIANKKTEAQMQEDLTLFLNEKAPTFSQWLHSVLTKLQKVTFGGSIEAKKAKAAKKTKGIENAKKKNKSNIKTSKEKDKDNEELSTEDSKIVLKNLVPNDKYSNESIKSSNTEVPVSKDGDNIKRQDRNRKSRSKSSSRSFSVSKSPSPHRQKFRNSRSPIDSRYKPRSPVNGSPLGYRDYRKNKASYKYSRRDSFERDGSPKAPNRSNSYERKASKWSANDYNNHKHSNYDKGPSRTNYERSPPTYRRSPSKHDSKDNGLRRNNHDSFSHAVDFERDKRFSSHRNNQRSRSPVRSRHENVKRLYSPINRNTSDRRNVDSFKQRSDSRRDSGRSSNQHYTQHKSPVRKNSQSISPSKERTLTSSIGAVISHESDGEYDAEKILKKSIVASKVSVASRPSRGNKGANPKIVRRAAMDAEMDIRRKKIDARKRNEELQKDETNRRQISRTRRKSSPDRNMEYSDEGDAHIANTKRSESRHVDIDHNKSSRTVRNLRKSEIKPREAAMDKESKAIKSNQVIPDDESDTVRRKIVRSNRKYIQNDSESHEIENELPDLRQRLVDRKQKRHSDKKESKSTSDSPKRSNHKSSILSKIRQKDLESLGSDEEEHQISGELKYDRNGRNILPKNLRIQATIRNDMHEGSNKPREEHERNKSALKALKRRAQTIEKHDITALASKKLKTDKSIFVDEEEDELLEMRRNAIESMQRRKEASKFETKTSQTIASREYNRSLKEANRKGKKQDRHNETVKREILEIQDGDSDAISSISSVVGDADMSDVSENTTEDISVKANKAAKYSHDEDSEISLSSSEAEDEIKTRIPIHTTNKNPLLSNNAVIHDKKPDADKKDPQFIVTLDGINSAYFKKEDKEVSKGGLKLKRHEPTSQTVYITSNRAPIISNSNTSMYQPEKPVISLPNNKASDASCKGMKNRVEGNCIVEKPKAMVAPLRKDTSEAKTNDQNLSSKEMFANSNSRPSNTTKSLEKEVKPSMSKDIDASGPKNMPKRKRILPPELSPTESPHSVLAGTNRYSSRTINQSSYSPGIMSICKYWPNCSRGNDCHYYHPKGETSKSNLSALSSTSKPDKFKWTSESTRP